MVAEREPCAVNRRLIDMRSFLAVLAVLAVLAFTLTVSACARGASEPGGVIAGTVTAGPTCPVELANSPCPPGLWTGTVRATASDGKTYDARTDDQGRYRFSLPAGTYEVIPVMEGSGPPTAQQATVTVTTGGSVHLDLEVDTGIR